MEAVFSRGELNLVHFDQALPLAELLINRLEDGRHSS